MSNLENNEVTTELDENLKLGDFKITIIKDEKLNEDVMNIPMEEKHCWVMALAENPEFDYNPEVGDSTFYDAIKDINFLVVSKKKDVTEIMYMMNLFSTNKFLANVETVDEESGESKSEMLDVYAYPRLVNKDGKQELKGVKFFSVKGKVTNKNIKGLYLNKNKIGSGIAPEGEIVSDAMRTELKGKYSEAKVEEIIKANVLGLSTKYIEELPEDFKDMKYVTLFLKNGYKVDKVLTEDLTAEQRQFRIASVDGSHGALTRMSFERPKHLWPLELQSAIFKVNSKTVYDDADSFEVAQEKLISFIKQREEMIFLNTYVADNLAIEDIDSQMISVIDKPEVEGVTKTDMLSALDFLGIYRITEENKDKYFELFKGNIFASFKDVNYLYRISKDNDEILCSGSPLGDLEITDMFVEILHLDKKKKKEVLDSIDVVRDYEAKVVVKDECKLFFNLESVESEDESNYIMTGELVKDTELFGKGLDFLRDANLTSGINLLTEQLPTRYLNNLRDRFEGKELIDVDFTDATTEEIELFNTLINALTLDVKFYNKDYGFRKTLAVPRLSKSGDKLTLKFVYGDMKINIVNCVRVQIDIAKPVSFDRQLEKRLAMTRMLESK